MSDSDYSWSANPWCWCITFERCDRTEDAKPILFSPPMVRAILDGRKSQTRRVVKPSNSTVLGRKPNPKADAREYFDGWINLGINDPRTYSDGVSSGAVGVNIFGCGRNAGNSCGEYLHVPLLNTKPGDNRWYRVRCAHEPGDVLWVREGWGWYSRERVGGLEGGLWYRADLQHRLFTDFPDSEQRWKDFVAAKHNRWRPSIHMPKWAARIFLRITDVRVQRVQEISEADAIAEGVERFGERLFINYSEDMREAGCFTSARESFRSLWDSINGKRG